MAPEEQPLAVSQVVRAVAQGGAAVARAGAVVSRAGSAAGLVGEVLKDPRSLVADPQRLLAPVAAKGASAKLNLLEILAMIGVVLLVGGFYLFGLLKFGFVAMLTSGTPFFCAYALGLTFGLAALRNVLDRPLAPILRLLQKVPPKVRLALGFAAPLVWVLLDSKDLQAGFLHAGFTITVATGLGHVLFRSLRGAP